MSRKYKFLYKTTNVINGKIYVGIHTTDNLNDSYLGSGKLLKRAIKKYGRENFTIEYLEWFNNNEELSEREAEIVDGNFIKRNDTYNLALGGRGCTDNGKILNEWRKEIINNLGYNSWYECIFTEERNQKIRDFQTGRKHYWQDKINKNPEKIRKTAEKHKGMKRSKETCENISKNKIGKKVHTKESKNKMSEQRSGKIWINKDSKNKLIDKNLKGLYLNDGWFLGRKIDGFNKNKIVVNRNGKTIYIKNEELQYYIDNGWNVGWCSNKGTTKGKIWVTKDGTNKLINKNELEKYINDSWSYGMYREKIKRIWVKKEEMSKLINENEKQTYLNEGWQLGRIYNRKCKDK